MKEEMELERTMQMERIMQAVLDDADNIERRAKLDGLLGDSHAANLRMQVKFYKYGVSCFVPPEWQIYADKFDPEYETYLRLKEKFRKIWR